MTTDPFLAPDPPTDLETSWSRPSFADRTFRTVMRGWDPKEVRAYLEELDRLHGQRAPGDVEREAAERARSVIDAARAEADLIIGAARRDVDE